MAEITFTSRITPISLREFNKVIERIDSSNAINYPWTIKDSKLAHRTYTKGICDCTACLIKDNNQGLLMHLCPEWNDNHNPSTLLSFIKNKINLKSSNLTAMLIGSKNTKKSLDTYEMLKDFLTKFNIPFSELKNGKKTTHIAYRADTDEIYISNLKIDKMLENKATAKEALENGFEKINIADFDEI